MHCSQIDSAPVRLMDNHSHSDAHTLSLRHHHVSEWGWEKNSLNISEFQKLHIDATILPKIFGFSEIY